MQIGFFEEFPDKQTKDKLKLLKWNAKIFVAAESIDEFVELQRDYSDRNLVFWPVLKPSDGYWISPFSTRKPLLKLFYSLKGRKIPVMLDLEFPRKRLLILKNFVSSFSNYKSIDDFILNYSGDIYTAEYLFELPFLSFMYKDPRKYNNRVIKMVYSSMHDYGEKYLRRRLNRFVSKYGNKFIAGLGTIATGVLGDEPKLTPQQLDRDLRICRDVGVEEVVIFRLGGLNADYLKVIKKYI